jgi:hypothetical protein
MMQCNIRSRKKFISEEHKAMRTELISIETDTLPLDGAFHRLDEITAQARALVAVGHGQELMLVPGWWYVITAESFLDRMTEMPDVRELAATIKCPTLFSDAQPVLATSRSCRTVITSMSGARPPSATSSPAGSRERENFTFRHSRESGNPGPQSLRRDLGPRFRGGDG